MGKQLGIFAGDQPLRSADNYPIAPVVQEAILDKGQITGLSLADATTLSKQLNYGNLP